MNKVANIMILPPTSEISHHHKVTNITMSPTSLSPKNAMPEKPLKNNFVLIDFLFDLNWMTCLVTRWCSFRFGQDAEVECSKGQFIFIFRPKFVG